MRLVRAAGRALLVGTAAGGLLLASPGARAAPVAVGHREGLAHGFVKLQALDGTDLAAGDLIQNASGNRVTARLRLRFQDGSLHEETTVYTQGRHFRLVSNHVVQKGPAFKVQVESTIRQDGRVTVRYTEEGGEEKVLQERLELPADVANGMTLALLKNIAPSAPKTTVSFVAITPKPRLVQLEITPAGEDPFSTAGIARKATHYVMKVHVPGVTGALASVLGKIPPDSHFWVLAGEAPAFVKGESPFGIDGPVRRIELVSPTWPHGHASDAAK
jgi:hypothetical protein